MKKSFLYLLMVLALAAGSCKKGFLDRSPLDQYSESSLWTSANDATAALTGVYSNWESGTWMFYMDCASDNAFDPYPWEGYSMYGNGSLLTPTNTGSSKWDFKTVQKCNWFLTNIDKTPMDETLKTRMKAEARFLRAYKYFVMATLYGDVPVITALISTDGANAAKRSPRDSVIGFVLSELDTAQAGLPDSYTGEDVGRITKGAALSLKARVELFNGKYADCLTSLTGVMGKYSLFPSYADLFRIQNEHNAEIVLDIEYVENDYPETEIGVMAPESVGGWWSINPLQSLVDNYETTTGKTIDDPSSGYNPDDPYTNRDLRLAATVIAPGSLYEGHYFDPYSTTSLDYYAAYGYSAYSDRKYVSHLSDFDNLWNTGLNIPLIRYAEVLLTYAEAKIELNQIDASVYDAIDQVRLRAGLPATDQSKYNSQSTLRTLLRRERRSELAMEGLRWYDVQRWKIADQTMNGTTYGARLGSVNPTTGALSLTAGKIVVEQRIFDPAKNYLWPIPQSQVDINKDLGQNPGY